MELLATDMGGLAALYRAIVEFKAEHQVLAARFRTWLEDECILLAYSAINEGRQKQLKARAHR